MNMLATMRPETQGASEAEGSAICQSKSLCICILVNHSHRSQALGRTPSFQVTPQPAVQHPTSLQDLGRTPSFKVQEQPATSHPVPAQPNNSSPSSNVQMQPQPTTDEDSDNAYNVWRDAQDEGNGVIHRTSWESSDATSSDQMELDEEEQRWGYPSVEDSDLLHRSMRPEDSENPWAARADSESDSDRTIRGSSRRAARAVPQDDPWAPDLRSSNEETRRGPSRSHEPVTGDRHWGPRPSSSSGEEHQSIVLRREHKSAAQSEDNERSHGGSPTEGESEDPSNRVHRTQHGPDPGDDGSSHEGGARGDDQRRGSADNVGRGLTQVPTEQEADSDEHEEAEVQAVLCLDDSESNASSPKTSSRILAPQEPDPSRLLAVLPVENPQPTSSSANTTDPERNTEESQQDTPSTPRLPGAFGLDRPIRPIRPARLVRPVFTFSGRVVHVPSSSNDVTQSEPSSSSSGQLLPVAPPSENSQLSRSTTPSSEIPSEGSQEGPHPTPRRPEASQINPAQTSSIFDFSQVPPPALQQNGLYARQGTPNFFPDSFQSGSSNLRPFQIQIQASSMFPATNSTTAPGSSRVHGAVSSPAAPLQNPSHQAQHPSFLAPSNLSNANQHPVVKPQGRNTTAKPPAPSSPQSGTSGDSRPRGRPASSTPGPIPQSGSNVRRHCFELCVYLPARLLGTRASPFAVTDSVVHRAN